MLLWIGFACLTAAVVALLLRPLRVRDAETAPIAPVEADLAVYRDQLRELDAERDRGLIGETEIESARAEVARRLLKRARTEPSKSAPASVVAADESRRARVIYTGLAAAIPVLAVTLYLATGFPDLPAQPYAARQAQLKAADPATAGIVEIIQRVEQRLKEQPEDGKGWDAIAPVYLRLSRYADAAHAFAEANRLEGETVRRLLGFAEATILAENGMVTEPVRLTAQRILTLEPERIEVNIWLALGKEQDGDLTGAVATYRDLLGKAAADAPWRKAVEERLALVEKKRTGAPGGEASSAQPSPPASPSAPAVAAPAPGTSPPATSGTPDVAAMTPAERDAFIAGMVDRLARRLAEDGKDLDGWLRLARAYKVMGRETEAREALASARTNFAGEDASLARIDEAAAGLGLTSKE